MSPNPLSPAYRQTGCHFVADSEETEPFVGQAAPAVGPTVAPTFPPCPGLTYPAASMSVAVAEGCFLSALHPNSSCTAYVVPSDGPSSDPVAKARRVREQVRMRLAEKSSSLPRLNDSLVGSTGEPNHVKQLDSNELHVLVHGFVKLLNNQIQFP